MIYNPERLQGEPYAEYKARRDAFNSYTRSKSQGQLLWPSQKLGTYNRKAIIARLKRAGYAEQEITIYTAAMLLTQEIDQ